MAFGAKLPDGSVGKWAWFKRLGRAPFTIKGRELSKAMSDRCEGGA